MRMTRTIHVLGRVNIWPASDDPDKGFEGEVQLKAFEGALEAVFRFLFVCLGEHPVQLTIWKGDQQIGHMTKKGACADTEERRIQLTFFGQVVEDITRRYLEQFKEIRDGFREPPRCTWTFEFDPEPDRVDPVLAFFD